MKQALTSFHCALTGLVQLVQLLRECTDTTCTLSSLYLHNGHPNLLQSVKVSDSMKGSGAQLKALELTASFAA